MGVEEVQDIDVSPAIVLRYPETPTNPAFSISVVLQLSPMPRYLKSDLMSRYSCLLPLVGETK